MLDPTLALLHDASADIYNPDMMNHAAQRKRLLAWVRSQLIGPVEHAHDGNPTGMRPVDRFACGILFPVVRRESGIDAADDDVDEEESEAAIDTKRPADIPAQPARKRRHVPPSAAGFSFFIRGVDIGFRIVVSTAAYRLEERDDQGRYITEEWLREPLQCSSAEEDQLVLSPLMTARGQVTSALRSSARVARLR